MSSGGRRWRRHEPGQRGIPASVVPFRRLAVRVGPDSSPFYDGNSGSVDPDHAGSVRKGFSLENPDPPPVAPFENGVPFPLEPRRQKGNRRAFGPRFEDFFGAVALELILQFPDGDLPFQKGFLPLEFEQIPERAASGGLFRGPRGDGRRGGIFPLFSRRCRSHQGGFRKGGPHGACSLG